ncbi:MAG: sugar phosphate nucleotidyltransferase, partial [Candidatus Omnitrophota bacterium]
MMRSLKRKCLLNKIVSLILVFTFSSYNASFAAVSKDAAKPGDVILKSPLIAEDIGIAIDIGTIKSKYQGDSGKTIIHIQDAHCNFEAQTNINKMLEQLASECDVNMISVEGAEGIVDTAWFRAFPDAEIRKEVATYFMKKGEITGAEFFSINSDYEGTIFGAETREYYIKNLKAFTEVYPYKDLIEKYFNDAKTVTSRLKSIIYPPKLKDLDQKISAFDTKEMELSDYAAYLEKVCGKNKLGIENYPNFKKLTQTLEYEEKIDFDIVDSERSTYIDVLGKKLPKKEMAELVAQSIRFKKGHIKAVDFYSYLRDLAREKQIDMVQEYPNLFYYYIYTKLYEGIDNEKLFKEIDAIQRELKEKFFTSDTDRTLDRYDEIINMYINLVNIELTNDDYDLFNEYSSKASIEDIFLFIDGSSSKYNLNYSIGDVPAEIVNNLPNMIDFYEIAMKRDRALIDNTLSEMEKQGKDRCVLIAGGFHTRGMKDLLEEKGVSYVVVTPKITKDVETPYIKVLTNQRTSLEDIITESTVMPGIGTSSSQDNMASQTAKELVSPLYRIGYAHMLFDEKGTAKLEKLSEELGSIDGLDEATFINRVKDTFTEAVSMATDEWLLKVHGNLMQEVGDGKWPEIWNDRSYQKDLLSVYLESIWGELQKIEKTKDITNRISDTESTYMALRAVAIKIFAEQFNAPAKPRSLSAAVNENLITAQEAIALAKKAVAQKNNLSLQKAMEAAYEIGNEERDFSAFRRIILSGIKDSSDDPETRGLLNEAILEVSKKKPLRIKKHLLEKAFIGETEAAGKTSLFELFETANKEETITGQDVVTVIMAGGGGERLFPLSTKKEPKQVTDKMVDMALVRMAAVRVVENLGPENVYIQTIPALKDAIYDKIKDLGIPKNNIFTEPEAADTSGAIGYAAAKLAKLGRGDDVMFIQTADHYIDVDSGKFQEAYMLASKIAKFNPVMGTMGVDMITIGPSSEYGCIRMGDNTYYDGAVVVDSFKEKPPISVAEEMIAEGKTMYNSGMYIVRPNVVIDKFNQVAPEYGAHFSAIARPDATDETERAAFAEMAKWKKAKETPEGRAAGPVDTVLSELLDDLFMVSGEFIWMDIGGYKAIHKYYADIKNAVDANSNVVIADNTDNVKLDNCSNCLVLARDEDVKISLKDINDALVVYNPETKAVLIAPLTVEGGSVKKLLAKVSENVDLEGYVTGFAEAISQKEKTMPGIQQDGDNSVLIESGTGNGIIDGSESWILDINTGMCMILDMKGDNAGIVVLINKQEGTNSPNISVKRRNVNEMPALVEETIKKTQESIKQKDRTPEMRTKYMTEQIINGEIGFASLTPDMYSSHYGIDISQTEKEISVIKARLDRYRDFSEKFPIPKFGTSGLRGMNAELVDIVNFVVTKGALKYMEELSEKTEEDIPTEFLKFVKAGRKNKNSVVVLAGDNRPYTEDMIKAAAAAIIANGDKVDYIGKVPTPTAALYGIIQGIAMAMITGSHIPISEDGIKFDRTNGEVWKEEEGAIVAAVQDVLKEEYSKSPEESMFGEDGMLKNAEDMTPENKWILNETEKAIKNINPEGERLYEERFTEALGMSLEGVDALFWQQTAVGRDLLPSILTKMGAKITTVGRREPAAFLTIDTENMKPEHLEQARQLLIANNEKVLLTTDGDSDRPVVIYLTDDDTAKFITGDKLGVLAAKFLEPEFFAIPDTANDNALKVLTDMGVHVETTDVGSPFVDVALYGHKKGKQAAGAEVNGGFFIGASGFQISEDTLNWLKSLHPDNSTITGYFSGLSTRDALT